MTMTHQQNPPRNDSPSKNHLHLQHLLESLKQLEPHSLPQDSDELHHLDRMILLGELVNGLAHELQNPIAGIQTAVKTLMRSVDESDRTYHVYQNITTTTQRLHALIHTILSFARKGEIQKQPLPVNRLITECVQALEKKGKPSVTFTYDLQKPLPNIQGDEHLMRLCFMNILKNAYELPQDDLRIHVSTHFLNRAKNVDMNDTPHLGNPFRCQDGVIQVRIQDNGPGIPKGMYEQIFQPFYTTKKEGTGFGLYFSSQIARQHRGCIFGVNNQETGATFVLCFPAD